ncbi:SCP2 sterol-binding domain-containing protein [Actinokineospora sp. G85]|uniref:SCP2 sterol-binding domain-containing protein n=1 Tax=Actinokineospora sp. G85 TaxID=3406626 RepID=UPI003C764FCC
MSRKRRRDGTWHRLAPTAVTDLDGFASAIDPAKLDPEQFVRLVETLDMLGEAGTGIELAGMRTETFSRFFAQTSRAQLDELMAHPRLRHVVFDEVFRRMAAHLDQSRAGDLRAVVHWRFAGGSGDGGYDRFETVIARGRCTTGDSPTADPRVTITIDPVDFLRAVTGGVTLPKLFISGKVRVRGDMAFAATMIGYFDLPTA